MGHLKCASFEIPFNKGEAYGSVHPEQVSEILDFLAEETTLHKSGNQYFWMSQKYPAQDISLRSTSSDNVLLQNVSNETTDIIGEVDKSSALWMVHPGAIYLHGAETYFVEELDLEKKVALLNPIETDYYTRPRRETKVRLINKIAETDVNAGTKAYGNIEVSTKVIGYQKIRWFTHENLGHGELSLPPEELQTRSYWIAINEKTIDELSTQGLWSNDTIDYGNNWQTQRDRARLRDNFRCQVCGVLEKEKEHHIHHKTPLRMFSSFREANRLENLITLCPACHRRSETAVRMRSGLAGLGYVMEHLAPLFLMCDIGDLGLHIDPRSPLSEGNPTVAIYDLIPDGIGFSERLFELHEKLVVHAHELVMSCKCSDGCPSCVGPGGELGSGGKSETMAILEKMKPMG
jgi:DEAD/DEAH box helicase domain-containing protein